MIVLRFLAALVWLLAALLTNDNSTVGLRRIWTRGPAEWPACVFLIPLIIATLVACWAVG